MATNHVDLEFRRSVLWSGLNILVAIGLGWGLPAALIQLGLSWDWFAYRGQSNGVFLVGASLSTLIGGLVGLVAGAIWPHKFSLLVTLGTLLALNLTCAVLSDMLAGWLQITGFFNVLAVINAILLLCVYCSRQRDLQRGSAAV